MTTKPASTGKKRTTARPKRLIQTGAVPPLPQSALSVLMVSAEMAPFAKTGGLGEVLGTLPKALERLEVDWEVLIGSDGSTDDTVRLAQERLARVGDGRWRVIEYPNEGKCITINKLIKAASGDLIVSTDADIPVPPDSIELIVRAFEADDRLGCVSCVPVFEDRDIGGQRYYWRMEDKVRQAESALGMLIVVTGMLYAFRREAFEEIPRGVMADDLWIPLCALLNGHDSVRIDELRIPYEKTDEITENRRRRRVILGGVDAVWRLWPRLVHKPKVLVLVLAHKVNRWLAPIWLAIHLAVAGLVAPVLLVGYAAVVAGWAWMVGPHRLWRLGQAAVTPLYSLRDMVRRNDLSRWEHTRRPQ